MKKFLTVLLVLAMVLGLAACGKEQGEADPFVKAEGSMTYEEYMSAEMDSDVTIEGYITSKVYAQAYGNVNLILQDGDGAYYVYRMPCTDADDAKLEVGARVQVKGIKTEWSGEVELKEGSGTYTLLEGTHTFEPADVTKLVGTDELIKYQNQYVKMTGATLTADPIFNWDGSGQDGDDLYFNVKIGDAECTFLVETDLCAGGSDTYETIKGLKSGASVDLEGFMYWYNGPQAWITGVSVK